MPSISEVVEIARLLTALKQQIVYMPGHKEKLPMTKSQLPELESEELFTIGLHTLNHADLRFHSANFQEQEIKENKLSLNRFLKTQPDIISFPYGSYNMESIDIVKKTVATGKLYFTKKDNEQSNRCLSNWQVCNQKLEWNSV